MDGDHRAIAGLSCWMGWGWGGSPAVSAEPEPWLSLRARAHASWKCLPVTGAEQASAL